MTEVQTPERATPAASPPAPSSSFVRNVWIALAAVALVQGTVIAIERSFVPSRVRPLHHPLSDLPLALGSWSGSEVELDARAWDAVGSDQQVNRMYTKPGGSPVSVHCASWMTLDEWTPHPPDLCYTTNGWELLNTQIVALPNNPEARIALQTYTNAGRRVVAAYWYEMDDRTFIDREGARATRRMQWGRREWSPLVKTLLQTEQTPDADSRLLDIAGRIYEFNRNL